MKTRKRASIHSIYWINLDRSTCRKQRMMNVFKHPFFEGLHLHRVPALDGKDRAFRTTLKQVPHAELHGDTTLPEYATLLSHIKAIQAFVQSGEDMA